MLKRSERNGRLDLTRQEQCETLAEWAKDHGINPHEVIKEFAELDKRVVPMLGYIVHTTEEYRDFLDEMYQIGKA